MKRRLALGKRFLTCRKRWLVIIPILALLAVASLRSTSNSQDADGYRWARDSRLIAHAMGQIDSFGYSNSREAFTGNYAAGFRVFEVDFAFTSDGKLVALHDWSDFFIKSLQLNLPAGARPPLSYDQFKACKIRERYATLGVSDVMDLLAKHPDAYLVTDTKITSGPQVVEAFNQIVAAARAAGPAVLDRIIPQIYNQPMHQTLQAIHPFKAYIYTLYATRDTPAQVAQFVAEKGIKAVTMPAGMAQPAFIKDLKNKGAYAYVHTINAPEEAKKLASIGVHGFYTDYLTMRDLDSITSNAAVLKK